MMLPMCELNVESDCSMLCSSPMSAKTASKTGRRVSSSGGNREACLRHQAEQPGRLERDGLAAGVRAGDQQYAELLGLVVRQREAGRRRLFAEPDADRDDIAGQERVAAVVQVE